MKTISIVIPFKGENVLYQLKSCINSLFSQTVLPLEIILVGNLNELKNINQIKINILSSKLVKYFPFHGDKNNARNVGIQASKGDFIIYLDHDMKANKYLIEDCIKKSQTYDALIIPERGEGGNFWENCKKLERELITHDLYTVTPRFYIKSIFGKNEKPFDLSFGLLDEWGFNNKLMKKKVRLGYSDSFILVKDSDFSITGEIKNKFRRGLWMKNFYQKDKNDAWKRINPINRGIFFYGKRLNYFIKEPKLFLGLIILKFLDFLSFMTGYLIGYFLNFENNENNEDLIRHYDKLEGSYLRQMYTKNSWTRYIDEKEKQIVLNLWNLDSEKVNTEKILDLGMGPGRWAKFFLDNHLGQVYGIDISPKMIEYAKKFIHSNKFISTVARMDDIPFKDKTFNRVFCFRAIKYVNNIDNVFQEVGRVLKKDGTFILEVSNNSLLNQILKFIAFIITTLNGNSSYSNKWGYFQKTKFYNKKTISQILSKHEFKISVIQPIFILPSIPLPTLDGKLTNLWKIIDTLLFKILPKGLFCRSWIIIATNNN